MARIDDLVAQVADPTLRQALLEETSRLRRAQRIGLVYERHLPERTLLPQVPLEVGMQVVRVGHQDEPAWQLHALDGAEALCRSSAVGAQGVERFPADTLVPVTTPERPLLVTAEHVDSVRGAEAEVDHALLVGENLHALQLLSWTHEAAVDCIYIDPPYNTGATEWSYNNDYVDKQDRWKHSKWLCFMEHRLRVARRLLKPDGVLIVAIDDTEQPRLALLLADLFPGHDLTAVTVVHNWKGNMGDNFSACHEYLLCLTPKGHKSIAPRVLADDERKAVNLRKSGTVSDRDTAKNCFYPIYANADGEVLGFGDVAPDDLHPGVQNRVLDDGRIEIWPIDGSMNEKKWRYARQTVERIWDQLSVRPGQGGTWQVHQTKSHGSYKTMWHGTDYDAGAHGTVLVQNMAGVKFPFPKSVYAVYEALYAATANKPDATILDFFGGSGTTLHATLLLNSLDGGRRRCVLVTNNEMAGKLDAKLRDQGLGPGDRKYDKKGIAWSVTWPRTQAAVTGDWKAKPAKGTWNRGDQRPRDFGFPEASVHAFRLGYHTPDALRVADPVPACWAALWLAGGQQGDPTPPDPLPDDAVFAPEAGGFAVLRKLSGARRLAALLADDPSIDQVFLAGLPRTAAEDIGPLLPPGVTLRHLPESLVQHADGIARSFR